jgi:multiple sugar transport system ATP-binding protein
MADINYLDATCIYPGGERPAVDSLNLHVDDGEFMVLVGPSGSGKTTALRMLAGLETVTSGAIQIAGKNVSGKAPKDRDIAMVFQNYALNPHLSDAENIGFGLRLKGVGKAERMEKVKDVARLLELEDYLERKPRALSGGQRQRVAMGRAIAREPSVFLMDEPLSNLDAQLRVETRANIAALQARLGTTTIYVTHDQVEAMTMGHRVALLKDGSLQQVDTPRNLYDRPENAFVAGFIGSPPMNLRAARLVPGGATLGTAIVPLRQPVLDAAAAASLTSVTLGIRPEGFTVSFDDVGNDDDAGLTVRVDLVEETGADSYIYCSLPDDEPHQRRLTVRLDEGTPPGIGDYVRLHVSQRSEHVFHPVTGRRLA